MLLTATGSMRGKKPIPLKQIADKGILIAAEQGFKVTFPNLACLLSAVTRCTRGFNMFDGRYQELEVLQTTSTTLSAPHPIHTMQLARWA